MLVLVLVAAIVYVCFTLVRSVPAPRLIDHPVARSFPGRAPALAWPGGGEAVVAIPGIGVIGAHDATRPVPIASVAKVMTAYIVLADHPLTGSESGPSLRVTAADAAAYRRDAAAGQSVLPVRAGERLTERQALEGLLLPSGNNVAVMLARWDDGSEQAFIERMNATAHRLGLADTHYTSASGFATGTVSSATDQVVLATVAFRLPVFRQIVGMPAAVFPIVGTQFNVDALVGHDGIVGIKTGSTSAAGGCFVFAAHVRVHGRTVTAIGAVLGQQPSRAAPSLLAAAFKSTTALLAGVPRALHLRTVIGRREVLATIASQWQHVAVVPAHAVRAVGWGGLPVSVTVAAGALAAEVHAGLRVATATVRIGAQRTRVPLVAADDLTGPSLLWRLTHP